MQGDGAGTEWGAERVLVQGPAVSRSFQDRAADAKPSSSEDDEILAYPAGKVSFVRQCLQVRPTADPNACVSFCRRACLGLLLRAQGAD